MRKHVARTIGLATKQNATGAIIDTAADGALGIARCDKYGNLWVTVASGGGGIIPAGTDAWEIFSAPAAATQATATQAANPAASHRTISLTATINATAAQAAQTLVLRDGATGVGTILWQATLGPVLAGDNLTFAAPISLKGTLNHAMTIEFTAAPAATNFNSVSLNGFDA